MLKNKNLALGIATCAILALVMARNYSLIFDDFFHFLVRFLFGILMSYYIVAYLFGWDMIITGGFLKKGENDLIRTIMFLVFICFWLWLFLTG